MEFQGDVDDFPHRKIKWMPENKINLILLSEYIPGAQNEYPRTTWIV